MNDNAKKWVAALRSGEFKQCKGKLDITEDSFDSFVGQCCLGVACRVYDAENPGELEIVEKQGVISYNGATIHLPVVVRDWLGLDTDSGRYRIKDSVGGYEEYCLTDKNDYGVTFNEIADIIESEPEDLFYDESYPR